MFAKKTSKEPTHIHKKNDQKAYAKHNANGSTCYKNIKILFGYSSVYFPWYSVGLISFTQWKSLLSVCFIVPLQEHFTRSVDFSLCSRRFVVVVVVVSQLHLNSRCLDNYIVLCIFYVCVCVAVETRFVFVYQILKSKIAKQAQVSACEQLHLTSFFFHFFSWIGCHTNIKSLHCSLNCFLFLVIVVVAILSLCRILPLNRSLDKWQHRIEKHQRSWKIGTDNNNNNNKKENSENEGERGPLNGTGEFKSIGFSCGADSKH